MPGENDARKAELLEQVRSQMKFGNEGGAGDESEGTEPSPPLRSRSRTVYLVLAGIAVYVVVVLLVGWRDVGTELLHADALLLAASFAIFFAGNWARAWKWRYALGPGNHATSIFFLSRVAAEWSPGRLGEFSPLAFKKHRSYRVGAWILLDRLIEIAVTLALGVGALGFLDLIPLAVWWPLVFVTVIGIVVSFRLITRHESLQRFAARTRAGSRIQRLANMIAATSNHVAAYAPKLPLALGVTVAAKCTDLYAVMLLFRAFGYELGFALVAAAKCAVAIVSFVPFTPLPVGVPQLTQAGLFNYLADVPADALAASIGVETLMVSVALWISAGIAASGVGRPG